LSTAELAKRTSIPRPTVYSTLKVFLLDGIIAQDSTNLKGYRFQQEKVNLLINLHNKKQNK